MKLTYTKISKEITKYFYQDGDKYGEFYIRQSKGEATLEMKDPDYGLDLIRALAKELLPTVARVTTKEEMIRMDHECKDTVFGNDCEYCNGVRKQFKTN